MILDVQGLEFSLGELSILNGVSFAVQRGETVGIIGPNGSGKTTLFNCLSGFHRPNRGRIRFMDHVVTDLAPYARARLGMGRVFQNSGVFREMTVLENLIVAVESAKPRWSGFLPWSAGHAADCARAREYLAEIGLQNKATHKAASLSGGQLRLLEIQRSLAFGAKLLLLDEPTAGVSPKMKGEVAGLIKALQLKGTTVLVIEHDLNFIQEFCSRVIVINEGRVALDGTPGEIRRSILLQEIYFGQG